MRLLSLGKIGASQYNIALAELIRHAARQSIGMPRLTSLILSASSSLNIIRPMS
jgi:hypothetical protein